MHLNENLFDIALHYIGRKKLKAYVVVIGAMDGVSFDESRGYIDSYNWPGLYVEPIPEQFTRLQKNVSNHSLNKFENSAISNYNGTTRMLRINQQAIDDKKVHPCFGGMSAIWPPKNGLASEGDKQTVERYGEYVIVPCITFNGLLTKHQISSFDILSIDTEGYDWVILKQLDLTRIRPKVIRAEYINLSTTEQTELIEYLNKNHYHYTIIGQNIDAVSEEFWELVKTQPIVEPSNAIVPVYSNNKLTVVTGIWNLGRDNAGEGFKRPFQHYIDHFIQLLKTDINLIVYIEKQYEHTVWEHRDRSNTCVIIKEITDFVDKFDFYNTVQKIRTSPEWYNQAEWLKNSTQATLPLYNPMVMSKMFMLHDAVCSNPFNTDYFIWLDGGITSTVHSGYFTHDKILDKITPYLKTFLFLSFPYTGNNEIHGFTRPGMNKYCNAEFVNYVCRGGLFGGHKDVIRQANGVYYNLLANTLGEGFMGTEESIFTIMSYIQPETFKRFMIEDNGMINYFTEQLKNDKVTLESTKANTVSIDIDQTSTALYVITFNSPDQFEYLINTYIKQPGFITETTNYLLDNSTDFSTTERYMELCKKYRFEHIKKDNIGICGGRQFIAEHFAKTNHDYYIFLEDDMNLADESNTQCRNGFVGYVPNLYNKVRKIIVKGSYDFVKFSFSEFYGDNGTQWAWYNVPQAQREIYWPDNSKLPVQGLAPNAPRTQFNSINTIDGTSYVDGEIYYCNWPQIVSKDGNQKMFLDTTWGHPYEQTWMSYMFQRTKNKELLGAVLLASPIIHHRFAHYDGSLRREN